MRRPGLRSPWTFGCSTMRSPFASWCRDADFELPMRPAAFACPKAARFGTGVRGDQGFLANGGRARVRAPDRRGLVAALVRRTDPRVGRVLEGAGRSPLVLAPQWRATGSTEAPTTLSTTPQAGRRRDQDGFLRSRGQGADRPLPSSLEGCRGEPASGQLPWCQ